MSNSSAKMPECVPADWYSRISLIHYIYIIVHYRVFSIFDLGHDQSKSAVGCSLLLDENSISFFFFGKWQLLRDFSHSLNVELQFGNNQCLSEQVQSWFFAITEVNSSILVELDFFQPSFFDTYDTWNTRNAIAQLLPTLSKL